MSRIQGKGIAVAISEKPTTLKLQVAAATDVGCVRKNNEDSFGYDLAANLFVVCDGMGGMAAGEQASATAVEEFIESYTGLSGSGMRVEERMHQAILRANARVFQMAQREETLRGMGTTLVAACVEGMTLSIANVGDSRAYFLRDGACVQITRDHSFVAEQLRDGVLTADEALASPLQSLITRAVGQHEEVEPDIFTADIENGDIVLLTTDGLTRYTDADAIGETILGSETLDAACHALIDRAKAGGGVDNITCVLAQLVEESTEAEGGSA